MNRKSIIQGLSIFVALIFVILTSGCATTAKRMYTGEALPKEQVAVIEGTTKFYYFVLGFTYIDVSISEVDDKIAFYKCEVLPGLHTVVVRVTQGGWFFIASEFSREIPLQLNAEAGHHYKIKARLYSVSTVVNIMDTKSGKIVASHP